VTSSQRWLITGACGQLGGHVSALLKSQGAKTLGISGRPCVGDHGEVISLDAGSTDSLNSVLGEFRPTHILHLAGIAAPAPADRQRDRAWAVHVTAARHLAAFAAATGGWLLYPSTDFVWDGYADGRYRETDTTRPATFYGRSKVAGEQVTLAAGAGAVVRFSLMLGMPVCPRASTWTRVAAALTRGETIPACVDEFRTPLSFADAAAIAVELGHLRYRGLVHAAGPEVLSSYELMRRIALALGVEPALREISRLDLPGGADRPRNVAMDATALSALLPDRVPEPLSVTVLGKRVVAA